MLLATNPTCYSCGHIYDACCDTELLGSDLSPAARPPAVIHAKNLAGSQGLDVDVKGAIKDNEAYSPGPAFPSEAESSNVQEIAAHKEPDLIRADDDTEDAGIRRGKPIYQDEIESINLEAPPSLNYTRSTISIDELVEESGKLADRFAQVILVDNDLKQLYAIALQSLTYQRFERNLQRLLEIYARDLLQDAKRHVERLAARAVRRHLEKILGSLRTALDPEEAARAAGMHHLNEQPVNKDYLMRSYLSGDVEPWQLDQIHDVDRQESESSADEDLLKQKFESIKPFLCNGAAFRNLKENFRKFLNPQQRKLKGPAPQANIEEATTLIIRFWPAEEMAMSFSDRMKGAVERIFNQPLLWWPLREPLRPLVRGMRRFNWTCVSPPVSSRLAVKNNSYEETVREVNTIHVISLSLEGDSKELAIGLDTPRKG